MASAIARIAEVFPVPGAPHSRTGTRAATAIPSASVAGLDARFGGLLTLSSVRERA